MEQNKRIIILTLMFTLVFSGIIGKTFYEQICKGPIYASKSLSNRTKQVPLEDCYRGNILDRHGENLTGIHYNPVLIIFPHLVEDPAKLVEKLHQEVSSLSITLKDIAPYTVNESTHYPAPFVKEIVTEQDRLTLSQWKESGLVVAPFKKRYGPNSLASHIVGYINHEQEGVKGIELRYNNQLQGSTWETAITPITDRQKNVLDGLGYRVIENRRDTSRQDVILTIDREIQQIVENTLDINKVTKGAAIILDINTGQILAAASRPNIQQDNLGETYGYSDNHLERAMGNDYKTYPGSIFKVITAVAALEEGVAEPDTLFTCNNHPPFDTCPREHGQLSFNQAMAVSCNNYFIHLGEQLGEETLKTYMVDKFGITMEPNKYLNSPGSRANGVLGQEIFRVSPLEMANMMATIARNGQHHPLIDPWTTRLTLALQDHMGNVTKVAQPPQYKCLYGLDAAKQIQDALAFTNKEGSGQYAWVEPGGSAGKTGTPEIILPDGSKTYSAWYVGYAPLDNPKFAMAVLVEEKSGMDSTQLQGGKHAGPIFKQSLEAILALNPGSNK